MLVKPERLELILTYNMNEDEAKAYKLCLLWETLTSKEFPNDDIVKLRKKGDPRKSTLFKYCYKLIKETKGLIEDKNYKFYIMAQLKVLKNIDNGKCHALIEPACLVGEKAWKRWKMWQNTFNKKLIKSKATSVENKITISVPHLIVQLEKTKKFLIEQFGHMPTQTDIVNAYNSKELLKWVNTKKISQYYPILTTFLAKLDRKEYNYEFHFQSITEEILTEYRKIFNEN